jgi:hypothetical protein
MLHHDIKISLIKMASQIIQYSNKAVVFQTATTYVYVHKAVRTLERTCTKWSLVPFKGNIQWQTRFVRALRNVEFEEFQLPVRAEYLLQTLVSHYHHTPQYRAAVSFEFVASRVVTAVTENYTATIFRCKTRSTHQDLHGCSAVIPKNSNYCRVLRHPNQVLDRCLAQ